jgi:glycosyltransferase involved in cell wall biosynthesis
MNNMCDQKNGADSYALILPVRNEEECLATVIRELKESLADLPIVIAVGLNKSTDRSRDIALEQRVIIGETEKAGYGYGCQIAMDAVIGAGVMPRAWIFVAGDGANNPEDIRRLISAHEKGYPMVLGQRTSRWQNWKRDRFGPPRALPNITLGLWVTLLTGRFFSDLGPLRLISSDLMFRMEMEEFTWGWTIESQIKACRLKQKILTISVDERPRLAGQQKVSAVSWRQSGKIGIAIALAGWQVRWRPLAVKKIDRQEIRRLNSAYSAFLSQ